MRVIVTDAVALDISLCFGLPWVTILFRLAVAT
jgi:hypothetical protein